MFKFTEGKEMEELKKLFEDGRADRIVSLASGRSYITKVEYGFVYTGTIFGKIGTKEIDWLETAKLVKCGTNIIIGVDFGSGESYSAKSFVKVKEDKVEKVVISNIRDLVKNGVKGKHTEFSYNGMCLLHESGVKNMVDAFNLVGGNFEYIEVVAIDTHEKLFNFTKDKEYMYVDSVSRFYTYDAINLDLKEKNLKQVSYSIKELEEKYNVDLKILK